MEFRIPLANKTDGTKIVCTTEDGLGYWGHHYNVVSLEVWGDTVYFAGLKLDWESFRQNDLFSSSITPPLRLMPTIKPVNS